MNEKKQQPDVTLSDGVEVYFDKHNIKPREWKRLFDQDQPEEEAHDIIHRFACLPLEYVQDMNLYDWQLIIRAAIIKVREPVAPNSPSGSTSPL